MRTKRTRLVMMAVVLVTIVAIIIVLLIHNQAPKTGGPGKPQATSSQGTVSAPSFTEEDAQFIDNKLSSSDKNEQAKVLVPELRSGQWDASAVLPKGATLSIDQTTFKANTQSSGSVDATVTGSVKADFVLNLAYVDGQWLISSTGSR